MIKFVAFAAKTKLNVHDLNNEVVAGNVTDIRMMEFLNEEGKRQEAPAVSGRMLKHWHYEAMRQSGVPLCAGCKVREPIRPGEIREGNLTQVARPEREVISSCAVCDIHGYLIAREAEGEQERGVSARRTSRAMFSWLMPVLETEAVSKQVIHNRVSSQPEFMMPFNKSYGSGIYGFVSALDVDRVGLIELNLGDQNPYAISDGERRERIKAAIEAYRYLLSGQIGASLSHALPHGNPIELLVTYSEEVPLPFPVSPIYSDYIPKTAGLMPENTKILYWGDETPEKITKKGTIEEIFSELLSRI